MKCRWDYIGLVVVVLLTIVFICLLFGHDVHTGGSWSNMFNQW